MWEAFRASKAFRTVSAVFLVLMLASTSAKAVDTSLLEEAMPEEAGEYVGIAPESGDLDEGLKGLGKGFVSLWRTSLKGAGAEGFLILSIASAGGLLLTFSYVSGSVVFKKAVETACICAVTALCISGASGVLESCASAIDRFGMFSSALIPVYAAAVAVSGSPLSSVSTASATLIFSNILIFVSAKLFVPMIYLHIVLNAVGNISESGVISGLSGFFKKVSLGFFKYFLMLYTGYITLSGLISSGTDAVTLKTAKVTISGSVPVLGSIVSDVSETMLSGASVLKNAVGIYGFIGAAAICLVPFVAVLVKVMVFKLLAVFSSSLCGGRLQKLLDDICDSYSIALGLLGTCCAIQFLSFVISSTVIKT